MRCRLNFQGQPVVEPTGLTSVVDRHRALGIETEHFDRFLEALLATIRELSHDEPTVDAWESTVRPGVEYVRDRCRKPVRTLESFVAARGAHEQA